MLQLKIGGAWGKIKGGANFSMHLHIVIYYKPVNKRASAHVGCCSSESKCMKESSMSHICMTI